ncbi:MAG: GntR family transcriptional regulator [Anaerolineaceae bacterium]
MKILISNSSQKPIYEQIGDQLKAAIFSGELCEGDELPSMRFLARELHISVITTKRAYEELEREHFVISVPGKGTYVAPKNLDLVRELRLREIEDHMKKIVVEAGISNISLDELVEMLTLIFTERE